MKKALIIPLTDKELQELYRILIDGDKSAALEFLDVHVRVPLRKTMESG